MKSADILKDRKVSCPKSLKSPALSLLRKKCNLGGKREKGCLFAEEGRGNLHNQKRI